MKGRRGAHERAPSQEPVGIVISRGREVDPAPVFSAYMYAPDPELDDAPISVPAVPAYVAPVLTPA